MSNPTSPNTTGSGPTAATDLPDLGSARLGQFAAAVRADPEQIGPYRILGRVGEGGMGVIFRAEQREPVRRTVAIKLIRWGMDSDQVLARFESERHALAVLDHPHVAKVLDAGVTDGGRPYFVMEFVAGEPITAYCDRHNYSTAQRLELFLQACAAVQHAHQKAIIHRDLKPSNILVSTVDDEPVVKVIDFGVAKALTEKLTDRTLHTTTGQLVGTPEYMSPEQAEGSVDVDTRTDVYALGVVLYELLCGALPFDPASLRGGGHAEIQRILRDVEPPRPSTKLTGLGAVAAQVAQRRQAHVPQLAGQLRRELEWIPLKSMSKDRTRRYATADQLADDVRNYLAQRPLLAGPEVLSYRARKFVRRNRGPVVAVAAVVSALAVGAVVTSALAVRLKRTADAVRAEQRTTRAVLDFLTQDMLGAANPEQSQVRDLSVKQALDRAAAGAQGKFAGQPLVEAAVRYTLSETYLALGQADAALPHARAAVALRRRALGDDHPDTIASISELGWALHVQGNLAEAEPLYLEALERSRRVLEETDRVRLGVTHNVAALYFAQGRLAEAESLSRQTLEWRRRALGDDHRETLVSLESLASLLQSQGKFDEAEALSREALSRLRRVLGSDHPVTHVSIGSLAAVLQQQGKYAEAEALFLEALERSRRVLGEDHPSTLSAIVDLGRLYESQGKFAEAEPLLRDAMQRYRRALGDEHQHALSSINNLSTVLLAQGKNAEAEPLLREVLAGRRRMHGDAHPQTLTAMNNLGYAVMQQGRPAEAEPFFAEVYRRVPNVEMDPKRAAHMMCGWGVCLAKLGRYAEAESALREAQRRLKETGLAPPKSVEEAVAKVQQSATRLATQPTTRPSTRPAG